MSLKSVNLAPGQIYYHELGEGPDLLFLHGAIATSTAYLPLLNKLSQQFHIIAPIHPGHGRSVGVPERWEIPDLKNYYLDLVNDLEINPRVIMGHSFGGLITLLLTNYLDADKILVMDCPCLPFNFQFGNYLKIMFNEAALVVKANRNIQNFKDIATASGTLLETIIRHPEDIPIALREAPKMDYRRELTEIQKPVNIFWGEDDRIVPLSVGEEMIKIMPHANLKIFPGKSHNYPVTLPEFTYGEINKVFGIGI